MELELALGWVAAGRCSREPRRRFNALKRSEHNTSGGQLQQVAPAVQRFNMAYCVGDYQEKSCKTQTSIERDDESKYLNCRDISSKN